MGQSEAFIHVNHDLFDAIGNIGPASRQFLKNWMDRYAAWVMKHAS
ncbi:hypothetical protein BH10PLA2_BH10PLA2_03870 [soil metagenome]